MKVGFVVEAISSLKVLGSLIAKATQYGITSIIFIPDYRKGKPYDTVTPQLLKQAFPELIDHDIHTYSSGDLATVVQQQQVDRICLVNPYRNFVKAVAVLAQKKIAVFGLDYFINSIYVTASHDKPDSIQDSLSSLTSRVVASDYWRDLEFKVQPDHQKYASKFKSLGSTLIDAFEGITAQQARQQLSLPQNKPIVSVFTPNIRNHQAYFFYGPATVVALWRLARMLRQYCDKYGYYLVVKSRAKQWDAQPFLKIADQYIQDLPEQVYPSTSTLLLKSSCLAFHFGSMMVLEAAGTYVPSIAFSPESVDKLHAYMRSEVRPLLKNAILNSSIPGLMNFGMVSQSLSIWPSQKQLTEVSDKAINTRSTTHQEYEAFNNQFSGWQKNVSATERILKHMINEKI